MGLLLAHRFVPKDPIPESVKHPLSLEADYASPYLYGGTAAIVGVIGLVAGAVLLALGIVVSGSIVAGLGAILFVAGFLVARYGR